VTKTILYTDGGCSGNDQPDLSKRKMIAVVSDEHGKILIDKRQDGGSNNIAELLAVKEALLWCSVNKIAAVEIRTDSMNNLAWVLGKKVGKKINDRNAVLVLKTSIDACRQQVNLSLRWIPRGENLAGHYIETKYQL
jgi:ribonuclease HI